MPIEAGGVNATLPLVVGALSGLPHQVAIRIMAGTVDTYVPSFRVY